MTEFKINRTDKVICTWKKTRNGFKHECDLYINGRFEISTKCCYLNRTWESFEYETVIQQTLEKSKCYTKRQIKNIMDRLSGKEKKRIDKEFGFIGMVAAMGNILCDDQKSKNDWKERMIKAGLGQGIQMPEDWGTLSEDEKERRLNGVIDSLQKSNS